MFYKKRKYFQDLNSIDTTLKLRDPNKIKIAKYFFY